MTIERFRKVLAFGLLWLMWWIVWSFAIRVLAGNRADNPAVQGLALDTIA